MHDPSRFAANLSRRAVLVTLLALALAAPAALVASDGDRAEGSPPAADVPFCSLPDWMRGDLTRGFREERSPDLHLIAARPAGAGPSGTRQAWSHWPQPQQSPLALAIWGHGVNSQRLEPGTRLDRIAPTLAEISGLDRPHPQVRSGSALEGVARDDARRPRLLVLIGWRMTDRETSFELDTRIELGSGTLDASAGSLPLDPAALFATLGSGALPHQHGITGTLIRNEKGEVVEAFSDGAPPSVVAALGDDLDERSSGRALVGLVGATTSDRGLIGADWYLDGNDDEVTIVRGSLGKQLNAIEKTIGTGYGRDAVTDLIGIGLSGTARDLDRALPVIERLALRAAKGSATFALVATPAWPTELDGSELAERAIEASGVSGTVIEAVATGSLFLDQDELTTLGLSNDDFRRTFLSLTDARGRIFTDAFGSSAIAFGAYC